MLSSAEAVISFSPMCSPEITERLYKSLRGFCKLQKSVCLNLLKFGDIPSVRSQYGIPSHHHGSASTKVICGLFFFSAFKAEWICANFHYCMFASMGVDHGGGDVGD